VLILPAPFIFLIIFQSRELEIGIHWKENNTLCGLLYLKVEDFFDVALQTLCLPLDPQGILILEVLIAKTLSVLWFVCLLMMVLVWLCSHLGVL